MKKNLSSLEINYLLREMDTLIGSKVDKIYNIRNEIILVLHVPNTGKTIMRIVPGKFLFNGNTRESSEEPSSFCMLLRKHLDNARLRTISQMLPERIVEFVFEKDNVKKLYAEFFSQGNIILCNENGEIITAQVLKSWKERSIHRGNKYDYPKSMHSIFTLTPEELGNILKNTEKRAVVTFLAIELGIGGTYSEEACSEAGINKDSLPAGIKKNEIEKLAKVTGTFLTRKTDAIIVYEKNEAIDAVPFPLSIYSHLESRHFSTFNEAIEFYFLNYYREHIAEKSPHIKEIERIKAQIKSQEEKIGEIIMKEEEERKKAEIIYSKYSLLSNILTEIRKVSEKYSWHDIKEKLKGHKIIKEVVPEEKSIVVEFDG